MRAVFAFVVLLLPAASWAITATLKAPSDGKSVPIFRSPEAAKACMDERKVKGAPGLICVRAVVALMRGGTPVSMLGGADGFIDSILWERVLVLSGTDVLRGGDATGKTGYVARGDIDAASIGK